MRYDEIELSHGIQAVTQRDIRDLLTRARERFDTIHLEWDAASNGLVLAREMERSIPDFEQRLAEGSIARFSARSTGSQGSADHDNPWHRNKWRVWWRKPSCWRDDIVQDWGGATHLACGALSSVYVAQLRTLYTNQRPDGFLAQVKHALGGRNYFSLPTVESRLREIPLVDPSFLASGWELTVLDERTHEGRKAVRVRAKRLVAEPRLSHWDYIKEYEILVDAERGILLRYAGIVDGEEAGIMSVRSVRFDEPIPDDVFFHEPPEGTKIAWVERPS